MDLYLINAATDAKRQACLGMTEISIWDKSEAIVQRRESRLRLPNALKHKQSQSRHQGDKRESK